MLRTSLSEQETVYDNKIHSKPYHAWLIAQLIDKFAKLC